VAVVVMVAVKVAAAGGGGMSVAASTDPSWSQGRQSVVGTSHKSNGRLLLFSAVIVRPFQLHPRYIRTSSEQPCYMTLKCDFSIADLTPDHYYVHAEFIPTAIHCRKNYFCHCWPHLTNMSH